MRLKTTTTTPILNESTVAQAIEGARAELQALEEKLKLVRGTREFNPEPTKVDTSPLTLAVEAILAVTPSDAATIADQLGVPVGRVSAHMRALRAQKRLVNKGTDTEPMWLLRSDHPVSIRDLSTVVLKILQERPITHAELVEATGASGSRVSGAITLLKKEGWTVVNMGTHFRAKWFVLPSSLVVS